MTLAISLKRRRMWVYLASLDSNVILQWVSSIEIVVKWDFILHRLWVMLHYKHFIASHPLINSGWVTVNLFLWCLISLCLIMNSEWVIQPFLCYHTSSTIPWPIGCEWHCLYFFRQRASCHYQQVVSGTACCPARYSHHVLNRMWVTLPFFLLWSVINSHAMINSMSVTVSSILYMHSHLFLLIICRKWVTLPFCFPGSLIMSYPIINRLWLSLPSSTKQSHYLSSHD